MTMATAIVLAWVALLPMGTNVASAHPLSCYQNECFYYAIGHSGTGAHGTEADVNVPSQWNLYSSGGHDDQIDASVWLQNASPPSLETGISVGFDAVCGFKNYFTPYGTINNDVNPAGDEGTTCTLSLSAGSTWQIQSYDVRGDVFSVLNTTSGSNKWTWYWGNYGGGNFTGEGIEYAEIHGYGGDQPYYSTINYSNEEWWNGSSWHYFGYTVVSNDCPYIAAWVDNTYWYSYDAVHC
jgi:hypothetical protein